MKEYDVVIIGAGPAGGQCARELAKAGCKVLLAERSRDFSVNNYSSAGAPLEIMSLFQLPERLVGANWNRIQVHSSHHTHTWTHNERLGVVLDFMKLRAFLADEAERHGAEIRMGSVFTNYTQTDQSVAVRLKSTEPRAEEEISTKILVDATGSERQVLAKHLRFEGGWFPSTGIEYLVQATPEIYRKWENSLSVFMGQEWMPQGYSWIFPMEDGKLKVGVGRYFQNEIHVPHEKSYTHYLNLMMQKCLGSNDIPLLDKHGKTIVYTYGRKDVHADGNVIAIGDSVSTINPLAFEGIRHAMYSATVASVHIQKKLQGEADAFRRYQQTLHSHFGFKWKLCETLMHIIYKEPKEENIDLMVRTFQGLSFQEMIDLAFHYKLYPAMKFLARYTLLKTGLVTHSDKK